MPNITYDNFYLSNEIEDQFNSHLDLQQFCTIDSTLAGTAGMLRKIHVYKATDGTQKLAMGEGNDRAISVGFAEREYRILLAQNRFQYFDEEAMTDPMIVPVGTAHAATDMFNTVNADVFAEFNKATLTVKAAALDFGAFVDAAAKLNLENLEGVSIFAFVAPGDMAAIRKNLKDDLKYVSEFSKNGYVGTVAGVNLYTKKDAVRGTVIVATKEAVTLFNKKGTEVEQNRDQNIRQNTVYSRKYYLAAMTDETKAVKIVVEGSEGDADFDPKKLKLPTEGDNLYGKTVYDLIGADVSVSSAGAVTGTIKYLDSYPEFSTNKKEQSGNYFPIMITQEGKKAKITKDSGTPKEVELDKDRTVVARLEKGTDTTLKIEVDDVEVANLTFSGATIVAKA